MPKVITYGGDTKIGAYKFADRKKVCLCIEKGNEITIYGTFNSEYCANNFMDELGKFMGAKFDLWNEVKQWTVVIAYITAVKRTENIAKSGARISKRAFAQKAFAINRISAFTVQSLLARKRKRGNND